MEATRKALAILAKGVLAVPDTTDRVAFADALATVAFRAGCREEYDAATKLATAIRDGDNAELKLADVLDRGAK